MSMIDDIDLSTEGELLAAHDFSALHERLHQSLRRRAAIVVASAVAIVAMLAGFAYVTLSGSNTSAPLLDERAAVTAEPPSRAKPTPARNTIVTAQQDDALSQTTRSALSSKRRERAAPSHVGWSDARAVVAPSPVPELQSTNATPPAPGDADAVGERSRLRAQLALYDDAKAAAASDPRRARELVAGLRAAYPDGPLFVEAGLLDVRVLIDMGELAEARRVLNGLETAALEAGKRAAWTALAASLEAQHTTDDDDDGDPGRVLR